MKRRCGFGLGSVGTPAFCSTLILLVFFAKNLKLVEALDHDKPEFETAICGEDHKLLSGSAGYKFDGPPASWNASDAFECSWKFTGSDGCVPMLSCDRFHLGESTNCTTDYLRLSDGANSGVQFCGDNAPENVISSNFIIAELKQSTSTTDEVTTASNFDCIVKCVSSESVQMKLFPFVFLNVNLNFGPSATSANPQPQPQPDTLPPPVGFAPDLNLDCDCGVPGPVVSRGIASNLEKIVGGTIAEKGYWRWQVALMFGTEPLPDCGGSLITDRHILTAAHCFDDLKGQVTPPLDAYVILNGYDFGDKKARGLVRRNIGGLTIHPNYRRSKDDWDVAVIEMDAPVSLVRTTEPILRSVCLPPLGSNRDYIGVTATATGWGLRKANGTKSPILKQVDIPIISNEDCQANYKPKITSRMMCAGWPQGGQDTCQGDSGGPFMIKRTVNDVVRHVQIGVTSFGSGCGEPDNPGGFARVTALNAWIRGQAENGKWCREP